MAVDWTGLKTQNINDDNKLSMEINILKLNLDYYHNFK